MEHLSHFQLAAMQTRCPPGPPAAANLLCHQPTSPPAVAATQRGQLLCLARVLALQCGQRARALRHAQMQSETKLGARQAGLFNPVGNCTRPSALVRWPWQTLAAPAPRARSVWDLIPRPHHVAAKRRHRSRLPRLDIRLLLEHTCLLGQLLAGGKGSSGWRLLAPSCSTRPAYSTLLWQAVPGPPPSAAPADSAAGAAVSPACPAELFDSASGSSWHSFPLSPGAQAGGSLLTWRRGAACQPRVAPLSGAGCAGGAGGGLPAPPAVLLSTTTASQQLDHHCPSVVLASRWQLCRPSTRSAAGQSSRRTLARCRCCRRCSRRARLSWSSSRGEGAPGAGRRGS